MSRWKQKERESKSLRDEDPHVDTRFEMEALLVVQHQHAGAEDTHVLEQMMVLPEQDTCVTEDPPAVAEDTPVCEVRVDNSKKEDPHVDEGQRKVRNEDSHGAEQHCVRVGGYKKNYDKSYTKRRAVPSLEYKLTSYAAWWRRVEKEEICFFKEVIKEEETRKKRKEENKGRHEKKKDFVSKFR